MPPERKPLAQRIEQVGRDLEKEDWYKFFIGTLSAFQSRCAVKPKSAICLGLGSPSQWGPARYQLALLIRICQRLDIALERVEAFDPVFTDEDKGYLQTLGVQVAAEDKEARYELVEPTLVYMPHCDLPFYNNLFEANWSKERLANMILLANDLEDYVVSGPTKRVQARGPLITRIVPYLDATPIPPKFPLEDAAFNDLQLQFVKTLDLPPGGDAFWEVNAQPAVDEQAAS